MSQVLYRKYRPEKFSDVAGQDEVVQILKKSISDKNVAHAYLFSGSRGTGKTSVARIFANELKIKSADVHEIDAASNRGIDDVRALREAVHTLPFESPYKIYIIDEVHMLTREAFNALLKTLEEPPLHVIFVLATTEFQKLPETIISRCQVFKFKKPTIRTLSSVIAKVAKSEGISIEKDAVESIALSGDGSFRDSLGVLQKLVALGEGKITSGDVERISGVPKMSSVRELVDTIAKKNIDNALHIIKQSAESGVNILILLDVLIRFCRAVLLVRFSPKSIPAIKEEFGEDGFDFIEGIAKDKDSGISSIFLKNILEAERNARISSSPELPLEIALLETIAK